MGRMAALSACLVLAAAFAAGSGTLAAAGTDPTCTYVESGPAGARGNYIEIRQPQSAPFGPGVHVTTIERRRIAVTAAGADLDCGTRPTVDNIDGIYLIGDGARRLTLDLDAGPLGPGATERGPGAEIEVFLRGGPGSGKQRAKIIVESGRGPNVVTVGRAAGTEQLNLNARRERRDDSDVFVENLSLEGSWLKLGLRGGDDTVDARGPGQLRPSELTARLHVGTGDNTVLAPNAPEVNHVYARAGSDLLIGGRYRDELESGGGRDRLFGGWGRDVLQPGNGRDVVNAGRGNDSVWSPDDHVDWIDCGPGEDTAVVSEVDHVRNCEAVSRYS